MFLLPRGAAARFPRRRRGQFSLTSHGEPINLTGSRTVEPDQSARRRPCSLPAARPGAAGLVVPRRRAPLPGATARWPTPLTPPGTGSPRLRPALANAGACVKSRQVSCAMFGLQVGTAKNI